MRRFNYGDWVYVSDELRDSQALNYMRDLLSVESKAGKRLKVISYSDNVMYRRGPRSGQIVPAYLLSGCWFAEHEVLSLEEHKVFTKQTRETLRRSIEDLL